MNISKILGAKYANLETAKVFVKPGQVIVTYDEKTYYIVKKDVFNHVLSPLAYCAA
ncbi:MULTISPECIES: hypothetical protein [Solibacillus]|uniref:Uncharacterized protein n=1 Tax=Solibacillus merdavium TaxID=2762218 RepID=A0ABR8XJ56_9BACL|nr:hypothetical protein [Solibacillus merdavium]MBD8031973.1 hypothetical protein [Solibacillus merdavium]